MNDLDRNLQEYVQSEEPAREAQTTTKQQTRKKPMSAAFIEVLWWVINREKPALPNTTSAFCCRKNECSKQEKRKYLNSSN